MTTEVETGVMQAQTQEHLEAPEAGRARKAQSPTDTSISVFWPLDCEGTLF